MVSRGSSAVLERAAREHDIARALGQGERLGPEVDHDRHIAGAEREGVAAEIDPLGVAEREVVPAAQLQSLLVHRQRRTGHALLRRARVLRPDGTAGAASSRSRDRSRTTPRRPPTGWAPGSRRGRSARRWCGTRSGPAVPRPAGRWPPGDRAPRPGTGRRSPGRASMSAVAARARRRANAGSGSPVRLRADAVALQVLALEREAGRVADDVVVRQHPGARSADAAEGGDRAVDHAAQRRPHPTASRGTRS